MTTVVRLSPQLGGSVSFEMPFLRFEDTLVARRFSMLLCCSLHVTAKLSPRDAVHEVGCFVSTVRVGCLQVRRLWLFRESRQEVSRWPCKDLFFFA